MARIIIQNYREKMDEFKKIHHEALGASSVAVAADLLPYTSKFQLWGMYNGFVPWPEENTAMRLGLKLEPIVASEFTEETKIELTRNDDVYQHDALDWAIATPDYFVRDDPFDGLVQIKTTSQWGGKFWENGEVPDHAHCQVQWEMGITGKKYCWVVCLAGGRQLFYKRVDFNKEVYEQLIELATKFWQLVQNKIPPEVAAADNSVLNTLYPPQKGKETHLDHAGQALAEEYMEAYKTYQDRQEIADKAKEHVDAIKASLRLMMGDSSKAITPSGIMVYATSVHYKEKVVKAYDMVRFSVKQPEA